MHTYKPSILEGRYRHLSVSSGKALGELSFQKGGIETKFYRHTEYQTQYILARISC